MFSILYDKGSGAFVCAPLLHTRKPLDQSDAGSEGIFSWRTNRTQEARVYSHEGPIGRRKETLDRNA